MAKATQKSGEDNIKANAKTRQRQLNAKTSQGKAREVERQGKNNTRRGETTKAGQYEKPNINKAGTWTKTRTNGRRKDKAREILSDVHLKMIPPSLFS